MKRLLIALAVAGIALPVPVLAAEVDMSKVTCQQVGAMPPGKTIAVAMWMNGYAHGRMGNPMVDGDKAHANAEKVADYCKNNPSTPLAAAIEAISKT